MQITLNDLVQIPIFESFRDNPAKLRTLVEHSSLQSFKATDIILCEGDEDDGAMFVIVRGSVIIAKVIDREDGRSKALATIRAGEYFGEMALFDPSPRSAMAVAHEDTVVLRLSRKGFEHLVASDGELATRILSSVIRTVSDRLRRTNMELVVLYDTGKIISRNKTLKPMCQEILKRLGTSLRLQHGFLVVFNELSGLFEVAASIGDLNLDPGPMNFIMASLRDQRRGLILPQRDPLEGFADNFSSLGCQSLLAVPLTRKSKVYGAIALLKMDGAFTDSELHLLNGVAQQASYAVENARNREDEAAREAYRKRKRGH